MSAAKKIIDPLLDKHWVLAKLREVSLLSDIHDKAGALELLSELVTIRSFAGGADIIREGSNGTEMFILVSGRAAVYKSTPQGDLYKVAIFEGRKNTTFGEGGLIESDSRTATIRTETDSVCLVLELAGFEVFSKLHPEWALPIYRRIAHSVMARLKNSNNDMLLLYNALVAEIRGD